MSNVRTGAQIIWETLVREGVKTVFGYPGGAILPAYDAMLDYPVRHVLVRHEQGATHMADGYARASGRCDVRAWRHEYGDWDCDSDARLFADSVYYRAGR